MSGTPRKPRTARIAGPDRGPGKRHRTREGPAIMPPSPELEERIRASRKLFTRGEELPAVATAELLDARAYHYIVSRPAKTRAHTFIAAPAAAPVTGTRKSLVLLVDFPDQAATETQAHFNDLLFSLGTVATGSMRDFYREASYGKLDVIGTISGTGVTAGWYRAPKPKTYYTDGKYGFGTYPKNVQKLVEDVIALADPHVNFAHFDNDGDGWVDALAIVAAGSGAEQTGNVNDIWSHKWGITPQTRDGVKIGSYFMAPEDGRIGVFAHELGHLLMGWPDLYDTDGSSRGTGRWDLMAGGSWNDGGRRPAHPTAWCKKRVDWVTPVTIWNTQKSVTIDPYAQKAEVYRCPVGSVNSKQYFLISNRQKTGFDDHLPGEGCIIEHVDENQTNNTDESHYLVDVEQCDGKFDLNKNANSGDANDPFPCGANSAFTKATTPSSKAYDGSDSQVEVKNIQRSGDLIKADIRVGAAGPTWHYNKLVRAVYSTSGSQYAWALIESLPWLRIRNGAADGVTNLLDLFAEALANGRRVHVAADSNFIYMAYLV